MAKKHQIYKCDTCGNIVEVLHGGEGTWSAFTDCGRADN